MVGMNRRRFLSGAGAAGALCVLGDAGAAALFDAPAKNDYQVGAYYFPQWHRDRHNDRLYGKGWTEWGVLKAAKPHFPGHRQPRVPAWGYLDEADPKVMEMKIDAAADNGVDFWIFDWYWNEKYRHLYRALELGYYGAKNNDRVKFCCMWANHDLGSDTGCVSRKTFDSITDLVTEKYFRHPSHYKIDGRPYFSIYDLGKFLGSFKDVRETKSAIVEFRQKTKAAGLPDLHLNVIVQGPRPPDFRGAVKLIEDLGFDSVTSYVWVHHAAMPDFPETEYNYMRDRYFEYWDSIKKDFKIPYFPNATMGWDASPRTDQSKEFAQGTYPYTPVLKNNSPEAFGEALRMTKRRLDKRRGPKIVTINAWNEWTEGSYLEPDTVQGMRYLKAIREVFGVR
ncbi:MAG: glycoside hydrolase family 99-like domain-containing protein [Armatimonadota bacterium]|nr:glycoside hydrolase family 99-like domain-containing protein [Armatimonadota bacterium]